jgi:magnesium transporter
MLKLIKKISKKAGLPPGELVHVGEKKVDAVRITLTRYDRDSLEEETISKPGMLPVKIDDSMVNWVTVHGLHQVEIIEEIGKHFDIHSLVLEDIVNTGHRPKIDYFSDYLFFLLNAFQYSEEDDNIKSEQVSIILKPDRVLTFLEGDDDILNVIKARIRECRGKIREEGADYLVYVILDTVVDHYFVAIDAMNERIEDLQEELIANPTPRTLSSINLFKRESIMLRKSMWPLREILNSLLREKTGFIQDSTIPYLKDVYDHIIQVIDIISSIQDMLSGMLDIYLSSLSNRMNEIMKVLTIIATIFIPLTFLAGIYGMNFKYMPELECRYGYFLLLSIMALVGILMAIYFWRKRWL